MPALVTIILIFFCPWAIAEIQFSGYIKNFNLVQQALENRAFEIDQHYQGQINSRLIFDYFRPGQAWQIHYEIGLEAESQRRPQAFTTASEGYRVSDIRAQLGPDSKRRKTTLPQNLDRLNVQFQLASGDLTLGRQAITFGSARIINPTDVFLPFEVRTLDTEYRTGIDAIRFQKPLGPLSELDLGVVLGADARADNSAAFMQLQTNIAGHDIQFSALRFSQHNLLGAGLQSSIGIFGVWLEAAQVSGNEDYFRASAGFDFGLFGPDFIGAGNILAMLEYHYNGAGSKNEQDYLSQPQRFPYQSGGVLLRGQNYLLPALNMQASVRLTLSLQGILNLDDGSLFINFNGDYNLTNNLYLRLGWYLFSGDDFRLTANQQVVPGSEYGGNPNSLIVGLRYYF
ncbi:MAG: hypothetical protein KUG79_03005 [Pseudomonadales bacterium]|nr:hypothetical protein [Pseudomonadales bacterium]